MQYILLRFIDWIFQSCFLQFYRLFSWNFGHKWWCAKPPLVFMGWTSWPCLVRTDDAIQSAKNMFLEVYPLLQKNILTLSCDWISKKKYVYRRGWTLYPDDVQIVAKNHFLNSHDHRTENCLRWIQVWHNLVLHGCKVYMYRTRRPWNTPGVVNSIVSKSKVCTQVPTLFSSFFLYLS